MVEYVRGSGRPELAEVFAGIAASGREIERKIRLAGLSDVLGAAGATNVQGEQQQKLDVFANDEMMLQELGKVASVAALVSEEDEEPVLEPATRQAALHRDLRSSRWVVEH